MAPILYKSDLSAPCRGVMLVAKALDVELEPKDVNLSTKEHLEAEFVEMNPEHSVPVLDDDGFILCDSQAINAYLATKYAPEGDDSFYPEDVQQRALINHKLHFNSGTLQPLLRQIIGPILFQGERSIAENLIDKACEVYGFLEAFLQDREWLVGDNVTVADLALIPSVTTLNIMIPIDPDVYSKLSEWIARVGELPCYEINASGLEAFQAIYDSVMNSA